MAIQLRYGCNHNRTLTSSQASSSSSLPSLSISSFFNNNFLKQQRSSSKAIILHRYSTGINQSVAKKTGSRYQSTSVVAWSSGNPAASFLDSWKPDNASAPPLSDILWPSAGAFAAMAILGKIDQMLAPRGISMSIAPMGAVCAVLFGAPSSPAARKYNMFMAQIFCSAIGVLVFSLLGPGWLARSTALGASIAFMLYTRSLHPPAASLPLLFIDGAKLHHLNFWYILFPSAAGCVLLSLIQEVVCYMKDNYRF